MIGSFVYLLCALTCFCCTILLFRAYFRNRLQLLFWSGICFVGLTLNNAILFVDLAVAPEMDLQEYRIVPALLGLLALIYGLIEETQ